MTNRSEGEREGSSQSERPGHGGNTLSATKVFLLWRFQEFQNFKRISRFHHLQGFKKSRHQDFSRFEDYLDGGSTTDIRDTLLKNGVRTRRGNTRFSLGSIRSILTNTHYNGSYVVHNKMSDEIITCSCPPILPPKTYSAVQEVYEPLREGRVCSASDWSQL